MTVRYALVGVVIAATLVTPFPVPWEQLGAALISGVILFGRWPLRER